MPWVNKLTPGSDKGIVDDDYLEEYYVRRKELDFSLEEFLQDHNYKPEDDLTSEHWLEYLDSVMHIAFRK
jgi:hypothetical protein